MTDDGAVECHELYTKELARTAAGEPSSTGGPCDTAHERFVSEVVYQKRAEKLLADENCMKLFIVSRHKVQMRDCTSYTLYYRT